MRTTIQQVTHVEFDGTARRPHWEVQIDDLVVYGALEKPTRDDISRLERLYQSDQKQSDARFPRTRT